MCKHKNNIKSYYYKLGHKRCHYCCVQLNYAQGHKNSATIEHIIPKSKGGTLRRENCLVVCARCNGKRRDKSFIHYVAGSRLPRLDWLKMKHEVAVNSLSQ